MIHNRIRIARTSEDKDLLDIQDTLSKGQPFYDTKTNRLFISEEDNKRINTLVDSDAVTSYKIAVPRKLRTKLDSVIDATFDGSLDQEQIPITGVLPISNGGTGVSNSTTESNITVKNAKNIISGGTIASNVAAVTQPITDSSTKLATTGFVNNVLNNQFNLNIKLLYMGNNYYIQSGIGILQPLYLNPSIPLNTPGILTITGYFEDTDGEFTQTTGTNFTCSVYLNNQLTDSKQSVNFSFQCAGAHSVTENTNNARAEFHRCYGTIYANRIEISSLSYFDYDNSGLAGAVVAKESNTQKCYVTSVVFCYR